MKKVKLTYSGKKDRYLYFLLDGKDIVYIGFTGRIKERLGWHRSAGKIFTSHKYIKLAYYNYENKATKKDIILGYEIERKLIKAFKPKYNGDCITGRESHALNRVAPLEPSPSAWDDFRWR